MTMFRHIIFFVSLVIFTCADSATVLKCCPAGQSLNRYNICEEDASAAKWLPKVYSPSLKILLPPVTLPRNFEIRENTVPTCEPGFNATYFTEMESALAVLMENDASLYINDMLHPPETFCLSAKGLLVCQNKENTEQKKRTEKSLKKCCPMDAVYSDTKATCILSNDTTKNNFLSEDTFIQSGFPYCENREYAIVGVLDDKYSLNADGTLRTKNNPTISNYCVEYLVEKPKEKASVFLCSSALPPLKLDQDDIRYTIYPIGFLCSIFFLSITLISSFLLPSSYHALHWKCQTHYVACLLIGDVLLLITHVYSEALKNSFFCIIIATFMHFFFLAAFFWLNTMCFNIWWTFRKSLKAQLKNNCSVNMKLLEHFPLDLRPTSLDKGQETYRLILYEVYAWGVPLIIAGIGIVMDQLLPEEYSYLLKPRFGDRRCWFYGDAELFLYFFAPVGILLLINLILFAATTRELTCGLWKREVVKSTTERTALSQICLKLVIVMGITWIADILSWTIGGPNYVWYFTDLINALQGLFIFIVVGCQPQVWSAVKRMWCFKNDDNPSRTTGRSYTSNATPSIINDHSSTKPVETLC